MLETEVIDRLFLELSQFTQSTTKKEAEQQREIERLHSIIAAYATSEAARREGGGE